MTSYSASSPALPSASPLDRLLGDGILRFLLGVGVLYSAYGWWALDLGWGWFAFLCVGVLISENAKRRLNRIAPFLPDQTPSLLTRFCGHPLIGVPVVLANIGWLTIGIIHFSDKGVTLDTAGAPEIITLVLFALPMLVFGRWLLERDAWKRAMGTDDTSGAPKRPATPAAQEKPVPVAKVLLPKVHGRAPSLPEAVQQLPPHLLELVREGLARVKTGLGAH